MLTRLVPLFVLAAACGDGAATPPDAEAPDTAVSPYCPARSIPLAPGKYQVYLNTEGVTLMPGCEDSRQNCSSIVTASTVVPAFQATALGRDAFIAEVVRLSMVRLAPYSIDIVTTRPASGDYYMITLGGDPSLIGAMPGTGSVSPFNCTTAFRNHVAIEFDRGLFNASSYATGLLSDLGSMLGLAPVNLEDDCQCRADAPCSMAGPDVCTFGMAAPITLVAQTCGRTIQDEPMMISANLGCR